MQKDNPSQTIQSIKQFYFPKFVHHFFICVYLLIHLVNFQVKKVEFEPQNFQAILKRSNMNLGFFLEGQV